MAKTKFFSVILAGVFLVFSICFFPGCFGGKSKTPSQEDTYTKMHSIEETNSTLQNSLYKMWTHSSTDSYDFYNSVRGAMVYEYADRFAVYSSHGERFSVYKNQDSYIASYTENFVVLVDENNNKSWQNNPNPSAPISNNLDVVTDEEGYLIVTKENFLIYFLKDFSNYFINEDNTSTFRFEDQTFTVPASNKLTETLDVLGEYSKFEIPAAEGSNVTLFKETKGSKGQALYANVYFASIWPLEYIETLKQNGFHVTMSEHVGLFGEMQKDAGRDDDNVWIAFDETSEFAMYVEVGWTKEYAVGTRLRILPANSTKSLYGTKLTTNTDWTNAEKARMTEYYGAVIPFVALGSKYSVGKTLSTNGDMPAHSNLGSQCYVVSDGYYQFLLEDYGQVLEENGYHLYQPPVDFFSNSSDMISWWHSDESKKYNCYINTETDIAIRLKYDHYSGNTIQVFKYSTLETSGYFES